MSPVYLCRINNRLLSMWPPLLTGDIRVCIVYYYKYYTWRCRYRWKWTDEMYMHKKNALPSAVCNESDGYNDKRDKIFRAFAKQTARLMNDWSENLVTDIAVFIAKSKFCAMGSALCLCKCRNRPRSKKRRNNFPECSNIHSYMPKYLLLKIKYLVCLRFIHI